LSLQCIASTLTVTEAQSFMFTSCNSHITRSTHQNFSLSINCAHLHPNYGEKTPEQQLEEMKKEEEAGEVDLNLQEYKKRRNEARRSPYPSVIVEVLSTPSPDYTPPTSYGNDDNGEKEITSDDIAKLNAIFNMRPEDAKRDAGFYDALEEVSCKCMQK
jgi:hypothetical protein